MKICGASHLDIYEQIAEWISMKADIEEFY
jgi:hypothetical protein